MAFRNAFYYDARSNLTCVLDPENGLTYYTYDADRRMTSVKNPWGEVTYYEYSPGGQMTKRTLGNGCVTSSELTAPSPPPAVDQPVQSSRLPGCLVRCLVGAMLLVGACIVLSYGAARMNQNLREALWGKKVNLGDIRRLTGIDFPAHAVVLNSRLEGMQGRTLLAKIAIPSSELPRWLETLPFRVCTSPTDVAVFFSGFGLPRWWDAGSARRYVTAQGAQGKDGYRFQPQTRLLIRMDEAASSTVYIAWKAE